MTGQAARPDHERPAPTNTHPTYAGIVVDGARPAVAAVTSLPRAYRLTAAEQLVLLAMACDSFDGQTTRPGYDRLAAWTGLRRATVVDVLKRLSLPATSLDGTERPALLARVETRGGGPATRWRLMLEHEPTRQAYRSEPEVPERSADRLPPVDNADQQERKPVRRPARSADRTLALTQGNTPLPPTATEHEHHDRAREALERIAGERWLPLDADELLRHAYRLGSGDPWAGYRVIREESERTLDGMNDPAAALRARLAKATVQPAGHRPPPPTEHEHGWTATVPSTCWRPLPNGQPCLAVREAVAS